jgi:PASTA domain/WD40-like Beta Propeller Repeat
VRRLSFLGVVLVALLGAPTARSDDLVVTPALECCSILTQTLGGVVTGTLPLPTLPYDTEVAHDGSVVFRAGEGTGYEGIWVVRPGRAPIRITTDVRDQLPTITYDASKIAFVRITPGVGTGDVYIANSDGTGLTDVLSGGTTEQYRDPEFSPDGKTLAVVCTPAGPDNYGTRGCGPQMDGTYTSWGVILMNLDGSNRRLILQAAGSTPMWFPDGKHLALVLTGQAGVAQVYALKTDGSDLFEDADPARQVTDESGGSTLYLPSISPDGSRIVFESASVVQDIAKETAVVVDVGGANRHQLSLQGYPLPEFIPPATGGGPLPTVDATHLIVPPVRGLSFASAKRKLRRAHLRIGAIRHRYSPSIPRGRVVAERPRGGTRVHRTSRVGPRVSLVVSRGPHR